jgi:hypothetical protein
LLIRDAQISPVIDDEPGTENQEAAGEWNESTWVEQIEHAAGEREHREGADATRPSPRGVREKILKGQSQEET